MNYPDTLIPPIEDNPEPEPFASPEALSPTPEAPRFRKTPLLTVAGGVAGLAVLFGAGWAIESVRTHGLADSRLQQPSLSTESPRKSPGIGAAAGAPIVASLPVGGKSRIDPAVTTPAVLAETPQDPEKASLASSTTPAAPATGTIFAESPVATGKDGAMRLAMAGGDAAMPDTLPGSLSFADTLVDTDWTWTPTYEGVEHRLRFRHDGTVWIEGEWSGRWEIIAPRRVRISASIFDPVTRRTRLADTELDFDKSVAAFRGTEFGSQKEVVGLSLKVAANHVAGATHARPVIAPTEGSARIAGVSREASVVAAAEKEMPAIAAIPFTGQIGGLEKNLAAAMQWASLPLTAAVPENIREMVASMQQGVFAESVNSPQTSAETYAVAMRISNLLANTFHERSEALARFAHLAAGSPEAELFLRAWDTHTAGFRSAVVSLHEQMVTSVGKSPGGPALLARAGAVPRMQLASRESHVPVNAPRPQGGAGAKGGPAPRAQQASVKPHPTPKHVAHVRRPTGSKEEKRDPRLTPVI